ncbi:MAG: chemotaxis protein CheA [Halobacteria archaeon]|nr:chemotaxis protein CheA [Halobacteria archaeon]
MDDYLKDFIRESEEQITELNNALLELESDPGNEEAMDSIFRIAHTLKGNFGAMGFNDASDLAHAVEDLLDEMRQGEIEVTPDVMDTVFDGVDEIEALLDEIADDGNTSTDPTDSIEEIRGVIEDEESESDGDETQATATQEGGDDETDTDTDPDADSGADVDLDEALGSESVDVSHIRDAEEVVYAEVSTKAGEMKGVDAMLALDEIDGITEILETTPETDEIQEGSFDESFGVFVTPVDDVSGTREEIESIGKVESVGVVEVPDSLEEGAEEEDEAETESPDDSDSSSETETTEETSSGSDDKDSSKTKTESVDEVQSIRVDVDQLDKLLNRVEELVTSRIKLRRAVEHDELEDAEDELDELDKISSSLQDTVMDIRLVPLEKIVGKFPRLVRDLARSQDKEINLVMEGKDIELDRTVLNEIGDPLMHLIRNAVDHGIESPEVREEKGKPREGTVYLRGERERDRVTIEIEDDGRGLDKEAIKSKAVDEGIMTRDEVEALDESEVYELIFHSGFSTTDEVTEVSGRGVGMDVVSNTIRSLDGSLEVESEPDEGTLVRLTLPVTVAIVKVLLVETGDEEYGIPVKNVEEIGRMDDVRTVEGEEVTVHDDQVYSLVRLGDALDVPAETKNGDGMLVRIKDSVRQITVHCDSVLGQEEVVVKPFEGILSGIPGMSGAAVLGEGDVVTILDVETL